MKIRGIRMHGRVRIRIILRMRKRMMMISLRWTM